MPGAPQPAPEWHESSYSSAAWFRLSHKAAITTSVSRDSPTPSEPDRRPSPEFTRARHVYLTQTCAGLERATITGIRSELRFYERLAAEALGTVRLLHKIEDLIALHAEAQRLVDAREMSAGYVRSAFGRVRAMHRAVLPAAPWLDNKRLWSVRPVEAEKQGNKLSPSEVAELVANVMQMDKTDPLVRFATARLVIVLWTAARPGEIASMTLDSFDFDQHRYFIPRPKKREKPSGVLAAPLESYLRADYFPWLATYRESLVLSHPEAEAVDEKCLFPIFHHARKGHAVKLTGIGPTNDKWLQKLTDPILRLASARYHDLYDLRRSCGQTLRSLSFSMDEIAMFLRNSPVVAETYYVEEMDAFRARIEAAFGASWTRDTVAAQAARAPPLTFEETMERARARLRAEAIPTIDLSAISRSGPTDSAFAVAGASWSTSSASGSGRRS